MARYDDLNTKFIGFFTFLSTGLLLAVIFTFQGLAYQFEFGEEERKQSKSEYTASSKVLSEQLNSLGGYKWVTEQVPSTDPAQKPSEVKRLRIPIQQAMEVILNESQQPKEAPAQT